MCRLAALILAAGSVALILAAGSVARRQPNFGWWMTDMETVAAARPTYAPAHRMLKQHHRRYKNEPWLCLF